MNPSPSWARNKGSRSSASNAAGKLVGSMGRLAL